MRGVLARLIRRLFAVTAVMLLAGAAALWLLVQQLPAWQHELTAWASRALDVPLRVGSMEAGWSWRGPQLRLFDVEVGEPEGGMSPVAARDATLEIHPLRVLREGRLGVHRLRLTGVDLALTRNRQGEWYLQGRPLESDGAAAGLPAVPDLQLVLEQGRLMYRPHADLPGYEFRDLELVLHRHGDDMQLEASARLPAQLGRNLEVRGNAALPQTAAVQFGDVAWSVYVEGRDVRPAAWSSMLEIDEGTLPETGRGDLRVWLDMTGMHARRVVADVDFHDVTLPRQPELPAQDRSFRRLAGLFDVQRDAQDWRAEGTGIVMQRAAGPWQAEHWQVQVLQRDDGSRQVDLEADRIELEDLLPFAVWMPHGELRDRWLAAAPGGSVHDLGLHLEQDSHGVVQQFRTQGRLQSGYWHAFEGLPALSGLAGRFRADADGGRLELDSEDLVLAHAQTFREPLALGRAEGLLVWRRGFLGWRLVGDDLQLHGDDLEARGHIELTLPYQDAARLELDAEVARADLRHGMRLLPAGRMPAGSVRWLDRAFPVGELRDGRVSLSGPLAEFPFDDGNGDFRAEARLVGVTLDYADHWPPIEGAQGSVRFEGASVSGEVTSGRIAESRILGGAMRIPDLRRGVLEVDAAAVSDAPRLLAFLRDSPAGAGMTGALPRVHGSGPAQVTLDLQLPLRDPEQVQWQSVVELQGVNLGYGELPLEARGLRGAVRVENGRVSAPELSGWIDGEPFTARLDSGDGADDPTRLHAQGAVSAPVLLDRLSLPRDAVLAGIADWELEAIVPRAQQDGEREPLRLRLTSDLEGLHSQLPPPLDKPARQRRELALELAIQEQRPLRIVGHLGQEVRWALIWDEHDVDGSLLTGNVHFGAAPPLLAPRPGLTVTGRMAVLDADPWLALGTRFGGDGSSRLQSVRLHAELARGLGQEVSDLDLELTPNGSDGWRLTLDSELLAGVVHVPGNLDGEEPLELDMQRLLLHGSEWLASPQEPRAGARRNDTEPLDPRHLPPMRVAAEEFGIGGMRFGRLDLEVERNALGLEIASLRTEADHFRIEGGGRWVHDGEPGSHTRLGLQLQSRNVAATLRSLDYDARLEAEDGVLDINLGWSGAPFSPHWRNTLEGELSVRLGSGRLGDVDPGAGRVFGLMSLSALPRRLALDFRDVFSRGLAFDSIQGDFLLIGGDAYTDNLRLRGPAGEIGLVGRTGLAQRDYEQQALVTADVGMALPAVGGLLGGPGVGAAILVFQEIFSAPLRGIGRAAYCIQGSWETPQVRRLTAAELEQERLCAALPDERDGEVATR